MDRLPKLSVTWEWHRKSRASALGTLMKALPILDRVRMVPPAAASFLVKFGRAITSASVKKVRKRTVLPASPSVKVWLVTLNPTFLSLANVEITYNNTEAFGILQGQ